MKNKILLALLIVSILSCKAQIVPVEQVVNNFDNVEEGVTTHIKDVNNVLDNYVGSWIGSYNGKDYTFVITEKTIVFDEEYNIYADVLIMKHKIVDESALTIIEDTTILPDEDAHSIGLHFKLNSSGGLTYILDYGGNHSDCGQLGEIYITLFNNNQQLHLILLPDNDTIYNFDEACPNGIAEQLMPTDLVVLTKQ